MSNALDYAHKNAARFREELKTLVRIPSVSTDPAFKGEVQRAAQWVADELTRIGFTSEVIPTARHPLVYAEWLKAGADKPTILIYGHYDVQPAVMEDGWDNDPFDPIERNGKLYARGACDNKGQFFAHIKAVESLLEGDGALPVNVKFIIEGEEESGGENIAKYVREHGDRLKADVCLVSDTAILAEDKPAIVYGLRGMAAMELRVTGPSHDLHSGSYGGSVHNPLQAIAEIIAQLHADDGSISVPGFYDEVVPLSEQERTELAKVAWDDWAESTGAPQPWGEAGYTPRERVGARPTLEINGLAGGYAGAGFKTVLPSYAIAKISCRLVANQQPERIYEKVRDYIAHIAPPTVKAELTLHHTGSSALVDINHPAVQAAVVAYEKGFGAKPVFMREGGSIPIVADFNQILGLPVVLMGFGLATDGVHGPNEHFTLSMFHNGIDTSIHFMKEIAESSR